MSLRQKQEDLLLDLRSKLVGAMHVQPFTIYTDATIDALIEAQPTSIEQLSQVKGFPSDGKRVKGFGEAIIAIFNDTNHIDSINVEGTAGKLEVSTVLKRMSAF